MLALSDTYLLLPTVQSVAHLRASNNPAAQTKMRVYNKVSVYEFLIGRIHVQGVGAKPF